MPPVRNLATAKPVKTERTHEENQERAYIAASRRSDRSLEARVESARRASEIHKKRTGRALRVTEQDVINEEMYEEEDEDLPAQYRRLTAHLQTGSEDFNRRYQAYMQSQVGTRMALAACDPAFANGGFMQSYLQPPPFPQSSQLIQPSHTQMQMVPTHLISPQSAPVYRHTPYPMPSPCHAASHPNPNPSPHVYQQRSASIALGPDMTTYHQPFQQAVGEQRRMSLPVRTSMPLSVSSPSIANATKADSPLDSPDTLPHVSCSPTGNEAEQAELPQKNSASASASASDAHMGLQDYPGNYLNDSPFSFALPAESQMALGGTTMMTDFPAMLMAGSEHLPQQSFYSYNPNSPGKQKTGQESAMVMPNMFQSHTSFDNTSLQALSAQEPQSATTATSDGIPPSTPLYGFHTTGFDTAGFDLQSDVAAPPDVSRNNSNRSSVSGGDWDAFLDFDMLPAWADGPRED